MKYAGEGVLPAEGVTLSGTICNDCIWMALRRSPIFEKSKDAEGVKLAMS